MVQQPHEAPFDSQQSVPVEIVDYPSRGYRETAEFLHNALVKIAELQLNPVTGLKDRRAFCRETLPLLWRAQHPSSRNDSEKFALAYIDIDGLKVTNDREGHARGDELLVVVAKSLVQQSRPTDRVYHLQGDEFAIVMTHFAIPPDKNMDEVLSEKIINMERRIEYDIGKEDFPLDENMGASVGVTLLEPNDTLDSLMARADGCMYLQKQMRRLEHYADPTEQY